MRGFWANLLFRLAYPADLRRRVGFLAQNDADVGRLTKNVALILGKGDADTGMIVSAASLNLAHALSKAKHNSVRIVLSTSEPGEDEEWVVTAERVGSEAREKGE